MGRPQAVAVPTPRPLTFDVLLTLASKVALIVVGVAGTIIIARTLGPSGRGGIAVALGFGALLLQFGILGLHSANSYFAAREPGEIPKIITNTLWASACLGTLLALAGLGLNQIFPSLLRGLDAPEIAIVLIGVPAALAGNLFQSILLAEGRMIAYNGIELGMAVSVFVGLAVGLLVFAFGVLGAVVILVGVNISGSACFFLALRHHRPFPRSPDVPLLFAMMKYGTRVYLATLLAYLVGRVNLFLVNAYLGNSAAGEFAVAVGLADLIYILPSVVALNLFPRIARGDESADTGAVFRSLTIVYGVVCLATVPLASFAIQLLYGSSFSQAAGIYYWLLPGVFCYGMLNVLAFHFAGRGYPLGALLVWIPGVVINFAIVLPLLAHHENAVVAAIAMSVSYALILALHMKLYAAEVGGYASLVPRPRETILLVREMIRAVRASWRSTRRREVGACE